MPNMKTPRLLAATLALTGTLACAGGAYDDTTADLGTPAAVALAGARLGFTARISAQNLGATPDPLVEGVSLWEIVSSRAVVRADGKGCSACHYTGSEALYRPEIDEGSDRAIAPFEVVDGRTWGGPDGWAARFVAHDEHQETAKPAYLRAAFAKWLDDGCAPRAGITWNLPVTFEALGHTPDPFVDGKSLKDIVSSRVSGRPDDKLCSTCHRPGSEASYRPALRRDVGDAIYAGDVVDGRAWRGEDGWAARFVALHEGPDAKPQYLRDLFAVWLEDGGL